jgi:hypothetical protein
MLDSIGSAAQHLVRVHGRCFQSGPASVVETVSKQCGDPATKRIHNISSRRYSFAVRQ